MRTDAELDAVIARLPPGLLDGVLGKLRDPNVNPTELPRLPWLRNLLDCIERGRGGIASTEWLVRELARHLTAWLDDIDVT